MRRMPAQVPVSSPSRKVPAALAAAGVLACLAGWMLRRGETADPPAPSGDAAAATPSETPAARPGPEPAARPASPPASKRRGIRWSDPATGSLADPAAPPHPLAACRDRRETALKSWRETSVDFEFSNSTLREIVTEMSRRWNLSVGIDPGLSPDTRLSCSISGLDAASAMEFLTEFQGLAWVVDGNGDTWVVPAAKRALYEPKEAVELAALEGALARATADLEPARPTEFELAAIRKLGETRFTPDPAETTLDMAWKRLWEPLQMGLNIDRASIPNPQDITLSFSGEDVPVLEALNAALTSKGLTWRMENGVPTVMTLETERERTRAAGEAEAARVGRLAAEEDVFGKSVALAGEGLAIRDVAERISKALDIGYRIDEASWSRAARYGFDGEACTLKEIFEALGRGAPVRVVYRDGVLWYLSSGT